MGGVNMVNACPLISLMGTGSLPVPTTNHGQAARATEEPQVLILFQKITTCR
jgi:hypothetical protein